MFAVVKHVSFLDDQVHLQISAYSGSEIVLTVDFPLLLISPTWRFSGAGCLGLDVHGVFSKWFVRPSRFCLWTSSTSVVFESTVDCLENVCLVQQHQSNQTKIM